MSCSKCGDDSEYVITVSSTTGDVVVEYVYCENCCEEILITLL